jgi:hypothetical protein
MSDNLSNLYVNNVAIIQENCKPNIRLEVCKINIVGYSLDNFKTFDLTGYTVLCRLGETCNALNYFPVISKIVINIGEQSYLNSNLQNLLPNIAKDLAIPEEAALQITTDFFSDKKVVGQPIEIQVKVYNIMRSAQNYIPMIYTQAKLFQQ